MKKLSACLLSVVILLTAAPLLAQQLPTAPRNNEWRAQWIVPPNDPGTGYGIYYFRKQIELAAKPARFIIHVSADNRYKLFINGTLVSLGPARGDFYYWNYETVDLAPYLTPGRNTVAALVYNEAEHRPEAQLSVRTAFLLQGNTPAEEILNTNNTWKCVRDKGRHPIAGFFAASNGEFINMNQSVKGWTAANFNDSDWPTAAQLFGAKGKGQSDGLAWMLVPSSIPQMELTYQRIPVVRKASGITAPAGFPATKTTVTIPANTTATLLLDQSVLTNAYINLQFSKGSQAGVSLRYAEALYDNLKLHGDRKGNRNEVEGKEFNGRKDSLVSDGSMGQTFTSLNCRNFRYILLTVQTQQEALEIDDIYGIFTGYPFTYNAVFKANNPEIDKMLEIGWRTARLCAMETYWDCPYYEQLQYIGDTRIQALVSYYNSGDDRLARNAISLMDHSRIPEGATQSRWPVRSTQIISTFSLWYIGVLHDYWRYRDDSSFIKEKLVGARQVLNFFSQYQAADGSLKNLPYWNFIDWVGGKGWNFAMPPQGSDGNSAILDLQLQMAYQWAAEMEARLGMSAYASLYRQKAQQLSKTIRSKYWNAARKLFADTKEKDVYSQHANALAILAGLVSKEDLRAAGEHLLRDKDLTQCTIYFKYYLHQALVKAGMGNDYLQWLAVWRDNINMGLTTWAEVSDLPHSRSDCHAWGASPNIEFYRTVLGIDSDAPGFRRIKIEPHLGTMMNVSGEMPHPKGKVAVSYVLNNGKWNIEIGLPAKTSGTLVWKGKQFALKAGSNRIMINNAGL
ncbi:alpha-L-rhamnosidase C-terminal domain-containing protein [Paraflavitalea sp. CAU 1676]|uniref:alpha-L-rhamnosidase-related protein n=1 Tax=Paraflavitalea sp. CAU 1676 TaxID=3032598 RepID=UPI0023DA71F1|nr:alpha-L-rhamnosidase C-terminal domain-containing protein [Paraflavitalea sp. CAU 1676]MDF2191605.1 alpha-L-rhamnosidase C-terminal domain-containing protein [Paraflavitalea sp. CAU 1676]